MNHLTQFLTDAAARPADAEALTECPEEVVAELNAAGISVGTFLTLLPQILALVRLVTGEGATVAQIVQAVLELLRSFKAAG